MRPGPAVGNVLLVLALSVRPAAPAAVTPSGTTLPVVITDSLGRRVEIPARVSRILSLEPEVTRIIVALGGGDRLVGIDFFLRNQDRLFPLLFPAGRALPVVSNQGQDLNFEIAMGLRPDIVFASPSEPATADAVARRLRAPVAALASIGRFRGLLEEMETIGRVLGREERAARLTGYFRTRLSDLARTLGPVPAGTEPRVYLSFWGSLLRTPVAYEPVDAARGANCAAGVLPPYLGTAGATVPIERVIRWDPDVILVQGNYPPRERSVTVEGVLGDPRLASVRAVRTGRVHYTFGFWYWWDPALVLVESLYLARLFYPERFPRFDLEAEGNAVFKEFYGVEGAFTALDKVLGCHEWLRK
jgi:iron complex transport system substrate-binding protein